ncbi:hypothetical protein [Rheinheimera fenheensis]|uniref:hypothetical protein n=1 Tax=Rheinheimera fenheensis TaxID=3152295 RepID=UPI0032617721
MLIVLPLLGALTLTAVSGQSWSTSEKRTLQSAINSALHSAEITKFYQLCKEQPADGSAPYSLTDKEQHRLQTLLQQKVHTQNIEQLLKLDSKLTQSVKANIVAPSNCEDSKAVQTLLDNYEVALFSLDIAMPLERAISRSAVVKTPQASSNADQQLIDRSHAIALVNVVDKQQLNAVQQANYLHPDYSSRYVFKVQHGWKANVSYYLGMHIFVSDKDFDKLEQQWLIFLDKNGHFIKALEFSKARPYLNTLKDAQWRYDVYGNLHRN